MYDISISKKLMQNSDLINSLIEFATALCGGKIQYEQEESIINQLKNNIHEPINAILQIISSYFNNSQQNQSNLSTQSIMALFVIMNKVIERNEQLITIDISYLNVITQQLTNESKDFQNLIIKFFTLLFRYQKIIQMIDQQSNQYYQFGQFLLQLYNQQFNISNTFSVLHQLFSSISQRTYLVKNDLIELVQEKYKNFLDNDQQNGYLIVMRDLQLYQNQNLNEAFFSQLITSFMVDFQLEQNQNKLSVVMQFLNSCLSLHIYICSDFKQIQMLFNTMQLILQNIVNQQFNEQIVDIIINLTETMQLIFNSQIIDDKIYRAISTQQIIILLNLIRCFYLQVSKIDQTNSFHIQLKYVKCQLKVVIYKIISCNFSVQQEIQQQILQAIYENPQQQNQQELEFAILVLSGFGGLDLNNTILNQVFSAVLTLFNVLKDQIHQDLCIAILEFFVQQCKYLCNLDEAHIHQIINIVQDLYLNHDNIYVKYQCLQIIENFASNQQYCSKFVGIFIELVQKTYKFILNGSYQYYLNKQTEMGYVSENIELYELQFVIFRIYNQFSEMQTSNLFQNDKALQQLYVDSTVEIFTNIYTKEFADDMVMLLMYYEDDQQSQIIQTEVFDQQFMMTTSIMIQLLCFDNVNDNLKQFVGKLLQYLLPNLYEVNKQIVIIQQQMNNQSFNNKIPVLQYYNESIQLLQEYLIYDLDNSKTNLLNEQLFSFVLSNIIFNKINIKAAQTAFQIAIDFIRYCFDEFYNCQVLQALLYEVDSIQFKDYILFLESSNISQIQLLQQQNDAELFNFTGSDLDSEKLLLLTELLSQEKIDHLIQSEQDKKVFHQLCEYLLVKHFNDNFRFRASQEPECFRSCLFLLYYIKYCKEKQKQNGLQLSYLCLEQSYQDIFYQFNQHENNIDWQLLVELCVPLLQQNNEQSKTIANLLVQNFDYVSENFTFSDTVAQQVNQIKSHFK